MMTDLTVVSVGLPDMVRRAASSLAAATTAAEVLDAREAADFALDMARRMARMAQAEAAHDEVVRAAHKAQGDALEIKAAASKRYYEETQAAIARGEIPGRGGKRGNQYVGGKLEDVQFGNPTRHYEINREGKLIAQAPEGTVRGAIEAALDDGRAPSMADVKRAITEKTWMQKVRERGSEEFLQQLDQRDFRAIRKAYLAARPQAQAMFRDWLAARS